MTSSDDSGASNVVRLEPERPASARGVDADADAAILEEVRQALEELRLEIRSRLPVSEGGDARGIDWMALVDELRSRFNSFGMSERSVEVDEFGMDELALQRSRSLLDFLLDRYWRVEIAGVARLPRDQPCLLVANRSGLLPYDGLMISHAVARARPGGERPRFLVADWLITLPFAQAYLARLGGVRACRENADRLLRTGHSVVAFPEGAKGAAKVFRERYQLKRFGRGGVVRTALEAGVPLVPVGVVGAEEAHPLLFKAHLPGRALGLPFLPVTPTFPLFGALGLLPLPTKWIITIGEPIDLDYDDPDAASDDLLVSRLTAELRASVQALVDRGLEERESVWS
jgi:1-acyl-sn-glycerol-3-phosphate acyltransferase